MDETERSQRRERDRLALRELREESSILQVVHDESDQRRWRWIFHGKGHLPTSSPNDISVAERHEIEVLLPHDYPMTPPEIRFLTPTFHPAIAADGETSVFDLDLPWEGRWGLDVICERLWDVLRGAYVPEAAPVRRPMAEMHFRALAIDQRLVDPRPLRDRSGQRLTNLFRYRPRSPVESATVGSDPSAVAMLSALPTRVIPPKLKEVRPARLPDEIVFLDGREPSTAVFDQTEIVFLDETQPKSVAERGRQ